MNPVPLSSPSGTVYTYACGVCHRVHAHVFRHGTEAGAFAAHSLEMAERCCRCSKCKVPLEGIASVANWCEPCHNAWAATVAQSAAESPTAPQVCAGIACVIGRGKCNVCGEDWSL